MRPVSEKEVVAGCRQGKIKTINLKHGGNGGGQKNKFLLLSVPSDFYPPFSPCFRFMVLTLLSFGLMPQDRMCGYDGAMSAPIAPQVLEYCRQNESKILAFLKCLVETESPSDNKRAVDSVGAILAQEFESLGGKIKIHPQKDYGDHLQADFHGTH